jgi:hypothetical protein
VFLWVQFGFQLVLFVSCGVVLRLFYGVAILWFFRVILDQFLMASNQDIPSSLSNGSSLVTKMFAQALTNSCNILASQLLMLYLKGEKFSI